MTEKVYSIETIRELLPYKYPMILVDRVWKDSSGKIFGLKNVTITEEFFSGHFPTHPIMPGVLQVEAAQQVAIIALKEKLDPTGTQDIYVKSMKQIKFRSPVTPGDRMLIGLEVVSIENGDATIKIENKVSAGVCTQGTIVLSTRSREYKIVKPKLYTEYDKSNEVVMDVNQLKEYMPHRYPFLFIDYVVLSEPTKVIAIKNVTYNDPIMHTYSPGYSVLPATIQCEIIAQAGCANILARQEDKNKLAFFGTIPKVEFYHPIHPGDQLRIELQLPEKVTKFGKGQGNIYVEDKKVSSGEVLFFIG